MQKQNGFTFSYALSIASQLGFLIVSSIIGFIVLGIWLDRTFQTQPFLLLISIFLGIGVTIYEVHHLMKPLITSSKKDDA